MTAAAMLVLVATSLLADAPADATKKDLEKFQGVWVTVPPENEANPVVVKIDFKNDGTFLLIIGKNTLKGTYKIDATTAPKIIDISIENRDHEGIYVLDGDTLKIQVGDPCQKQRPTEFTADSERSATLKREK